jgi:hypothetical protein
VAPDAEGSLPAEGLPLVSSMNVDPERSLYLAVDLRAGDWRDLRVRTSQGEEVSLGPTLSPRVGVATWTVAQRQVLGDPTHLVGSGEGARDVRLRGVHLTIDTGERPQGRPISHVQILTQWAETLFEGDLSEGSPDRAGLLTVISELRARLLRLEEPGYHRQQYGLVDLGMCLRALRRRAEVRDLDFLGPDAWALPLVIRPLVQRGRSPALRRAAQVILFHPNGPAPERLDALYAHELVPSDDPGGWLGPARIRALGAQVMSSGEHVDLQGRFRALVQRWTGGRR